MKSKKMTSLIILALGVVLFIFARYEIGRVNAAKGEIGTAKSMFSGNAYGNAAGGYLEGQASKYDMMLMLFQVGGIALFVIGGVMFWRSKKR